MQWGAVRGEPGFADLPGGRQHSAGWHRLRGHTGCCPVQVPCSRMSAPFGPTAAPLHPQEGSRGQLRGERGGKGSRSTEGGRLRWARQRRLQTLGTRGQSVRGAGWGRREQACGWEARPVMLTRCFHTLDMPPSPSSLSLAPFLEPCPGACYPPKAFWESCQRAARLSSPTAKGLWSPGPSDRDRGLPG